ncbi:unnamed protein product [Oppiella nova]|uniref:Uncharacterized protein n=1 Tax=Oppiella nova TaxID=334625 RepID=A0A7R9LIR1_9ACAR|nr:unnamed protein product [Oppiella nova]CAG2164061.1 unnamed protein product [Oppiella nova]
MNIYLTIVVVLCAVGASLAITEAPVLKTRELNHIKGGDRETEFECTYKLDTGETFKELTVKKQGKDASTWNTVFTHTGETDATSGKVDGEIAEGEITIPDKKKNVFRVKKATKVDGVYKCNVDPVTGSGKEVQATVKALRETVEFKIHEKDAKDNSLDFKADQQLDASLEYELADGDGVFIKAEFKKDEAVYLTLTAGSGTDADKIAKADQKDKGVKEGDVVDAKRDKDKKLITYSIKNAYKETGGKFKAVFYYKLKAADADPALQFDSNEVDLKYTGAAATTMLSFASISTLLLALVAVRSNL